MRNRAVGTALVTALMLGRVGSATHIHAQERSDENQGAHGILYLVGARKLVEVDLRANTAKSWPLLTLAGLEESEECNARHVPPSCDWSASETRLDLVRKRMYFVTPAANPGDGPGPGEEEPEATEFVVWVVSLADFKPIKKIGVPFAQKDIPTIVLIEDGRKLLVSYGDEDGKSRDVDTIETAALRKISTVKQSSSDVLNTYFPAEAYFVSSGKFIVRGDNKIQFDSGQFREENVNSRVKILQSEPKKLNEFAKTDSGGQKFLPGTPAASLNGKTLEWVVNEAQTKSVFWTVDMATGATSPAVVTDDFAKAELIGAGEEFAVFESKVVTPTGEAGFKILKSGRLTVYSVKTGEMVREFNLAELRGEGAMLCSSADGAKAAYAHGHELMMLDLRSGKVTRVAGSFADLPQGGYLGACAFGE